MVELHQSEVLAETHHRIEKVYFPHSGIISCIVQLKCGNAIQTGMIGNDGAFGAGQALDDRVSLNQVMVQVAGVASVISSHDILKVADEFPTFRKALIKYEEFFLSQVQQTAACNAVHTVQSRTCKWLLRMHELVGDDLPLTQETLAQMMGVRRTSVTQVAGELQRAGMITYGRGRVHIVDPEQVRQCACECDENVRSHYRRIFGSNEGE
jgi:CRP-like cAMP-binding protein